MKSWKLCAFLLTVLLSFSLQAWSKPEPYVIDTKGAHAFIQFKIKHLGYSWLLGEFKDFSGHFVFDEENPSTSKVEVKIDTASLDSNHAERDKHLRGEDFLDVKAFPKATFVSTKVEKTGEKTGKITGDFTLKGVTKPLTLEVNHIGGGRDPWGGYRQGFEARTQFKLADFDITYDLGPASEVVEIYISLEGTRDFFEKPE